MTCPVCHGRQVTGPPLWLVSPEDRKLHGFRPGPGVISESVCNAIVVTVELIEVDITDRTVERCLACMMRVGRAFADAIGDSEKYQQEKGKGSRK